jgi:hypothetical protein
VGVEYVLGELVVDDEDDEALLNIEELNVDAGTGRAFSLDPLEVDELPILGESKGEGVIDVDANAFVYFVSLIARAYSRKLTRPLSPPLESAHPSSHGIPPTEVEAGGFGDEVPFTKSSKFISPPLAPFVLNALPSSRVWLYVLVCCSIRLTSRRCRACSSSTRDPRVLITLLD